MRKDIRLFVMDVDGTLTDGKIYMGADGELCKAFHIKDGCGIHDLLIPAGIIPIVITGRSSVITENRCRELGIEAIYQGVRDKRRKLEELLEERNATARMAPGADGRSARGPYGYKNIAYIGDDINDLSCMESVKKAGGLVGCPADAAGMIRELACFVSGRNGGEGAVREFIEWILRPEKPVHMSNEGITAKYKSYPPQ